MPAATILGLGFAGSLTAHRLAEAGYDVTVIDPCASVRIEALDRESPLITPGIGQSAHLHVLLGRGLATLGRIYPGFSSFLDEVAAPTVDWAADTVWRTPFGTAPRYDSGVRTRSLSRPLLDAFMLQQAARHPRIRWLTATAKNVCFEAGRTRGVVLATGSFQSAALVVDARGAGSTISEDLALGDRCETRVPATLTYRTVVLTGARLQRQHYDQPHPLGQRDGAVLTPIEHGRAVLTAIHYPGSSFHQRPLDETLASLADPMFLAAYTSAEAVSRLRSYQFSACVWRRFGRCRDWPEGLAVLGDAAYRLNPVFGQGMTVTALAVETLARRLAATGSTRGFQAALDRLVAFPWRLSSQTPGSAPGRLIDLAVRGAFASRRLHRHFLAAQHLLHRPALEAAPC